MLDGAVTFRGSSTITRTRAVRVALHTPSFARARALVVLVCGKALAPALVLDLVPSRQQMEQACAVVVLVK